MTDRTSMGRYWSQDCDNYNRIVKSELKSFRKKAWSELFARELPSAGTVLDFGCGPGFFSIVLSNLGHRVLGMDISEKMVQAAKNNAAAFCEGALPTFLHSDKSLSELPGSAFDAVVMRNVTWTLSDPEGFYRDVLRILKPAGKLMVFDANWFAHLVDPQIARLVEERRIACVLNYGETFDGDAVNEELDPLQLPLTHCKRPAWDVEVLDKLGFAGVEANADVTGELWDDKEKLLYGETPLFCVTAVKPA